MAPHLGFQVHGAKINITVIGLYYYILTAIIFYYIHNGFPDIFKIPKFSFLVTNKESWL